uniref:Uncharacterized protein n=1 Tax=Lactuca sativa TaxID=4236 RepID=A0A9R1WAM9_LACSA|nr:hypothetical protein LSAT_V11C200070070 [Lactuca sativa]
MKNLNQWLEGKGKKVQYKMYCQEQVQVPYENYINESFGGSISSQESILKVFKWKEVKAMKVDVSQGKVEKEKLKVETSPLRYHISMLKAHEVDLIDKLKTKVCI